MGDENVLASLTAVKSKYGYREKGADGAQLDEAGAGAARGGGGGGGGGSDSSAPVDVNDLMRRMLPRLTRLIERQHGLSAPQPPFQSGSTAYSGRPAKRYLAWNLVGAVTSRRDADQTTIDVDFADTTLHRALHFRDEAGFTMAALSEAGVLYGCPYSPPTSDSGHERAAENGRAARLRFSSFGSGFGQAATTDWMLEFPVSDARRAAHTLPRIALPTKPRAAAGARTGGPGAAMLLGDEESSDDADSIAGGAEDGGAEALDTSGVAESPVAVALGDGWVVAATDRQLLRFVRTGGAQDAVLSVPGPVVTVAARGALCAVAYHRAAPSGFTQRMAVDVYLFGALPAPLSKSSALRTAAPQKLATVDLPLRPHCALQWLDFATNGMLLAHDSSGQLQALQPAYNWAWTVLCDTHVAMARSAAAARSSR